jgi:hypothetical protein
MVGTTPPSSRSLEPVPVLCIRPSTCRPPTERLALEESSKQHTACGLQKSTREVGTNTPIAASCGDTGRSNAASAYTRALERSALHMKQALEVARVENDKLRRDLLYHTARSALPHPRDGDVTAMRSMPYKMVCSEKESHRDCQIKRRRVSIADARFPHFSGFVLQSLLLLALVCTYLAWMPTRASVISNFRRGPHVVGDSECSAFRGQGKKV